MPASLKSFLGHLEGTSKADHTRSSYRYDLQEFALFLREKLKWKVDASLEKLGRKDLERFHEHLKAQGQKSNTRRRKLMTLRKFIRYLNRRNKLDEDVAQLLAAPGRVERVPARVPYALLAERIQALPIQTAFDERNRLLLWTLLETGAAVSELASLRWDQLDGAKLSLEGRHARVATLPAALAEGFAQYRRHFDKARMASVFPGFNRFGPISAAMSPRGVELLLKSYALKWGYADLTPRLLRHSTVAHWLVEEARPFEEVQRRLGLKTAYSLRVYGPLVAAARSTSETTSSA